MKYSVAVKGIIKKDEKILIVKRTDEEDHRPGVWETVGGRMDHEKAPEEELMREILEETGLSVEVCEPFNTFSFVRDTGEFIVGITYICKHLRGEVVLSDEHTDYRWIDPVQFGDFESTDSLKREIAKYTQIYHS